MKLFKDNEGREWSIAINVAAVKRLRSSSAAVDLLSILAPEESKEGAAPPEPLLKRLATDPVLLVDTLFELCREQASSRGISDEQFGTGMGGDAIERATTAFLEELADFFQPRERGLLKAAFAKMEKLRTAGVELATRRLESQELDEILADLSIPGSSSTSSPASAGSIPGHSR